MNVPKVNNNKKKIEKDKKTKGLIIVSAGVETQKGFFLVRKSFDNNVVHIDAIKREIDLATRRKRKGCGRVQPDDVCYEAYTSDGEDLEVRVDYLDSVRKALYGDDFSKKSQVNKDCHERVKAALEQALQEKAASDAAQAAQTEKDKNDAASAAAAAEKAKVEAAAAAEAERKDKEVAESFELSNMIDGLRVQRMQLALVPQPAVSSDADALALDFSQVCPAAIACA